MRHQLGQRLATLKSELEKGQIQFRHVESQAGSLRETLLRISGAIMVLEELLVAPASVSATSDNGHRAEGMTSDPYLSASAS